jgi:NAD(P)-dependent dehydrogenase (short-subunit alcohol dehydrogenase family)
MAGRLEGKTAIIVGAGQTPGETIGNGRAMAILFAREGAHVMCVDRRLDSAEETVKLIADEGGQAFAFEADVTNTLSCAAVAR